ncbi:hypothetical protein HYH02_005609 [Chlamydomonas schloesseri]|uniref:Uncharacterized protein n=1 Tax=Chlamydomonas schloesseri TaxID=2026947 RepID=A0A835WLK0_9CHLO|nr:hypothetical protein HYH02_005609 [Chlamydomonas schloesseri]|eukprot:KAG2449464.1 hypothetical protein HYH02_005609 [Chlamydomonas schloesseri]
MNSKGTYKELANRVCEKLQLDVGRDWRDNLALSSRTPSSSSSASSDRSESTPLAECALLAEQFAEKHMEVEVDLVGTLRTTGKTYKTFKQQMEELIGLVNQQQSQLNEQQSQLRKQQSQLHRLGGMVAAHHSVLLRHVVDLAHKKLEKAFPGLAAPQMDWSTWLTELRTKEPQYLQRQGLYGPALELLRKGPGTPYQAGNEAAHEPQLQHVQTALEEAAREEPAWNALWAYVNRREP